MSARTDSDLSALILFLLASQTDALSMRGVASLSEEPLERIATLLGTMEEQGLVCPDRQGWWQTMPGPRLDQAIISALPILESQPQGTIGHCLFQLHVGRWMEGAEEALLLAEQGLFRSASSGTKVCLDISVKALLQCPLPERDDLGMQHRYMECCLRTAGSALYLTSHRQPVQGLLERARALAETQGNLRDVALTDLLAAYVDSYIDRHNTAQVQAHFERGLRAIESLGDEDILERAAGFLAHYYFALGQHELALPHLERASRHSRGTSDYFGMLTELDACAAACYLGRYRKAIGMWVSGWRRAELEQKRLLAAYYHGHLANYLTYLGFFDDALEHVDAAMACVDAEVPSMLAVWVLRPLAYYHLRMGRVDASYHILAKCLETVRQKGLGRPFFAYPWFLDMLYEYSRHGLPSLPGCSLNEELDRALKGPNEHLRGIAWRIRAIQERDRGADQDEVYELLQVSIRTLESVRNPIEVIRTRLEAAETLESAGREEEALQHRQAVVELASELGLENGPHLLAIAAGGARVHELSCTVSRALQTPMKELCRKALQKIPPWIDIEDFYDSLVNKACGILHMPRGALFRVEDQGTTVCLSALNMSELETKSPEITGLLNNMQKDKGRQPFQLRGRNGMILGLPLNAEEPRYVLCLHGLFLPKFSIDIDMADVQDAMYFFSVELAAALRTQDQMEKIVQHRHETNITKAHVQLSADSQILHRSEVMSDILTKAELAAPTEATLLIQGETGVGKELLARYVHVASGRKGSFVPVNISGISETLFESEFFGHEKGAFTGADRQKIGMLELADRGTLFIDEVGEIPLILQVKLLRVLQDRRFMRVGGVRECRSDFRLVAATNRDLTREVRKGRFREDLYYRLSVFPLEMPPLRNRGNDVLLLAQFFLDQFAYLYRRPVPLLESDHKKMIKSYAWPGNVRELKSVMERAVILYDGRRLNLGLAVETRIMAADHPDSSRGPVGSPTSGQGLTDDFPTMDELQRRYIAQVLDYTKGKICGNNGAERILDMKRATLYNWIKRYGLRQGRQSVPEQ